jgi:ATP-dependent helicase HrpB
MIVDAERQGLAALAAEIAVVLTERGLGGDDADLRHRIDGLRRDRSPRAMEAKRMAARWAELATNPLSPPRATQRVSSGDDSVASVASLLVLAYPDRIGKNRGGGTGTFLLANGRGAGVDPASSLAREPHLVVAELTGRAGDSRILLAASITQAEIESAFADRIESRDEIAFDPAGAALRARRTRRLGSIALAEQPVPVDVNDDAARMLAEGLVRLGLDRLPWSKALAQWRGRVMFLRRAEGDEWPDLSDTALAETVADWLVPALDGKTALTQFTADDLSAALHGLLSWPLRRRLDAEAPTHVTIPSGRVAPIDYDAEAGPTISARVQEFFGLAQHPAIACGRVPLVVELLSPAQRPVQVTRDLPGFWRGSYAAVRTEMRGRYPKHPWPDDPLNAAPVTPRRRS